MSFVRVAVTNEMWQPLASMVVECFNLDTPTTVIETVTTDVAGIAIFNNLPTTARYFFKARVTRHEGKFGQQPLYGEAKIQILGSSGVTCYDALVEPTGQFGTHTTIQAAINAFATGNIGSVRPAFIAVKPAGDATGSRYAEALSFTSTRRYVLHGCAGAQGWHGSEAADSAGLTYPAVLVRSPAAATATVSTTGAGTGQLEMSGFLIEAPATATVAYTFTFSLMSVKLINVEVRSALTGAMQAGTATFLFLRECVIGDSATKNAIDMGIANAIMATDTLFVGRADLTTQTGARLAHCVVRASNATQAVDIGNANAGTSWRIVNCYILQSNVAGNGILVRGSVAATDEGCIIVGNYIRGAAGGTGILVQSTVEGAAISGNIVINWSTGVDAGGATNIVVLGNSYPDTTTATTGGGGAGTVLELSGTAAVGSAFVTIGADATLTAERALTGSASILVTDGGANSTVTLSVVQAGVDHGSIGGLADDDHTQYLLLAGRGAEQDIVGGITVSTYARVGSNASPTNVTAGDLTAIRLHLGDDDAFAHANQLLRVNESFTPGTGDLQIVAVRVTSTPGAGVADDIVSALDFRIDTQPTANHAGQTIGAAGRASHTAGAFNLTHTTRGLAGVIGEVNQDEAATTVSNAIAVSAIYRAIAGTITTAYGLQVSKGQAGDAGAITTGVGVRIEASAGVTPTNDISIQAIGAQHMRHVGDVMIGADAAPQASIHLRESAYGGGGPAFSEGVLIERNGDVYLQFLTPNANESGIFFGDVGSSTAGAIIYSHANTRMQFQVEGFSQLFWQNGDFIFQVATTIGSTTGDIKLNPASTLHILTATNIGEDADPTAGFILEVSGNLRHEGTTVFVPGTAQTITAAATAITITSRTIVQINADASYTLTAAPTVADGTDGQIIIIINVDTVDTITLQDQGTLASSNLRLSAATIALAPRDSIVLLYNTTVGDWVEIGQTNVI
mgnify:CR=1 FL=1